ncbi:hypothetical protein [Spirillospora sp. NPDC048819]|uniref:hypothetical protein n=1 Tax=Spirillospora sp. NPDC048819 TaxID=3155268 RepID=UPI0033F9F078
MTRVRWWGTGVVALVLLILCGGLPLLNGALGIGGAPLAPGTVLSAGTERDGARPVTLVVPSAGWMLSKGDTSLTSSVELFSGDVVVNLNVVVPLGPMDARRLWDGLGRIVAVGGQTRLGVRPAPIMTAHGLTGLTGRLMGRDRAGMAAVFATDTLGATVTAAGPPRAFRKVAAEAEAMAQSVRIRAPWP